MYFSSFCLCTSNWWLRNIIYCMYVLYVFLLSYWHVCSKFITDYSQSYRILQMSEASHVEGLIPMWAKDTVGIRVNFFSQICYDNNISNNLNSLGLLERQKNVYWHDHHHFRVTKWGPALESAHRVQRYEFKKNPLFFPMFALRCLLLFIIGFLYSIYIAILKRILNILGNVIWVSISIKFFKNVPTHLILKEPKHWKGQGQKLFG